MDLIYRIFMFIFPFAIGAAGYIWLLKKVLVLPNSFFKYLAITFIAAGMCYIIWQLVATVPNIMGDRFNVQVLLANFLNMAVIAIFYGIASPENENTSGQNKKRTQRPPL